MIDTSFSVVELIQPVIIITVLGWSICFRELDTSASYPSGVDQVESHLHTFPNTYYLSYATRRTCKVMGITVPSGILEMHLLFIRILQMSLWRHLPNVPLPYKGYSSSSTCIDEDCWDNDGALNNISMTHPHFPVEHPSHLVVKDSDCQPFVPGICNHELFWSYINGGGENSEIDGDGGDIALGNGYNEVNGFEDSLSSGVEFVS
ncbi:hypothetical protein FXO37_29620 [Capsicum annuum]|nr:hypothetical protein FXO37_29620 [Capsicum annuum]